MSGQRPDFAALAQRFVHEEVGKAEDPEAKLQWVLLMNCFDAWLGYHGVNLDQNRSVRNHKLVDAMSTAGFPRTGKKGRFRVTGARLYVGTPSEFLADIESAIHEDEVFAASQGQAPVHAA